jgi:type IV pilus assembly protein PilX
MALMFVLIMISIVFVIAAVSSRIVTLGERAARNDRDRQTAFQAAEAALSDAEMDIMGPNPGGTSAGTNRVAMFGTLPADRGLQQRDRHPGVLRPAADPAPTRPSSRTNRPIATVRQFWRIHGPGGPVPGIDNGALPVKLPRYIIEKSAINYRNRAETAGKPFDAFVVTAIGYGLQPSTQVVLQAVISKPVPTN